MLVCVVLGDAGGAGQSASHVAFGLFACLVLLRPGKAGMMKS